MIKSSTSVLTCGEKCSNLNNLKYQHKPNIRTWADLIFPRKTNITTHSIYQYCTKKFWVWYTHSKSVQAWSKLLQDGGVPRENSTSTWANVQGPGKSQRRLASIIKSAIDAAKKLTCYVINQIQSTSCKPSLVSTILSLCWCAIQPSKCQAQSERLLSGLW